MLPGAKPFRLGSLGSFADLLRLCWRAPIAGVRLFQTDFPNTVVSLAGAAHVPPVAIDAVAGNRLIDAMQRLKS